MKVDGRMNNLTHMSDFPKEPVEFGRCWSSAAGELNGIKRCIVEVERRAADAFVRGQDQNANALRDLAVWMRFQRDESSKKVDDFIAENRKRDYEMRPKH
jgi:hypothetical protein